VDGKPAILELLVRKLGFGNSAITYVDVSCAEPELFPEFDDVVRNVLEEIKGSDHPGSTAAQTVARWRKLFSSRLIRGLSQQAKLGLFAELTLLSHLLDADSTFSIDRWRGPLREPHDFEAPTRCLEVKAIGETSESVVIHGLRQLATHDGRPLDLVLVHVSEDPDGLTIAQLVDEVRDSATPLAVLRSRLAAVGWFDDPQRPDTTGYAIDEVRRISVDAETPRIVPSSLVGGALPTGIGDLSYTVELPALLPFASGASLADIAEESVR
jgi:hypothetical protein